MPGLPSLATFSCWLLAANSSYSNAQGLRLFSSTSACICHCWTPAAAPYTSVEPAESEEAPWDKPPHYQTSLPGSGTSLKFTSMLYQNPFMPQFSISSLWCELKIQCDLFFYNKTKKFYKALSKRLFCSTLSRCITSLGSPPSPSCHGQTMPVK